MNSLPNITPLSQPPAANPLLLADEGIETALLGGLIIDVDPQHKAFKQVMHLTKDHFANPRHKKIYLALHALYERGIVFEIKTILSELQGMGGVSEAGEEYLYSLVVQAGSQSAHYAKILQEIEWVRDAETQVANLLTVIRDRRTKGSQKAKRLNELSVDLMRKSSSVYGTPSHILSDMADIYNEGYGTRKTDDAIGLSTGYAAWDRATKGFKKGKAYGIAGRPGYGKSILGQTIMMNLMRSGRRTLIISLEMDEAEYFDRALCIESQIEDDVIKRAAFEDHQIDRFNLALERFTTTYTGAAQMHLKYMDMPTLAEIEAKITALYYQYGLDAVMIDYLDDRFITSDNARDDAVSKLGKFSRKMATIAKDLNIIMIEILQTTRESEKRGGKPEMSDVYGASALEKDLYFLGVLKIDAPYSAEAKHGKTDLHIVKSRSGGTHQVIEFESRLSVFTFLPWGGS